MPSMIHRKGGLLLVFTLFLVAATRTITAAPISCSSIKKRSSCKSKKKCFWRQKQGTCEERPTHADCKELTKRKVCRQSGCRWNKKKKRCSRNQRSGAAAVEQDPEDVQNYTNLRPSDENEEFWKGLIGMTKEDAITEIQSAFNGHYRIVSCPPNDFPIECEDRAGSNYDRARIYLENGKVSDAMKG